MALPSNALTTVAAVESALGIPTGSETALLERLIAAVSEAAERYCARRFGRAAVVEKVPGYGAAYLEVSRTPIESVTSVALDGAPVSDYSLHYSPSTGEAVALYRAAGWAWTAQSVDAAAPFRLPGTESRSYEVSYTGGYVLPKDGPPDAGQIALPADLEEAAIAAVVDLYLARGQRTDIASESIGDASAVYRLGISDVPDPTLRPSVRAVLSRYRRML